MSLALTNLSLWWLKGKKKDPKIQNGSSLNPSPEVNSWESDTLKFPLSVGSSKNRGSKSTRFKKKLLSRQEQKIDKEHDVVLVPSDGGCISDSDSDASDWSIGWSEPHGSDFENEDEKDDGFGVLVPCYGAKHRDAGGCSKNGLDVKVNSAEGYSSDNKKEWLYTYQTS